MIIRPERAAVLGIAALLGLAFALPLAAYWPGVMTWDAVREYGMALRDPIDDWHPPVMIWLWRQLLHVGLGPGPMLLLQLALYVTGWGLVARSAWASGSRWGALALAACSLFPIALVLEGAVLKDCLMAGALLVALGLVAQPRATLPDRLAACVLLIFAATLRYNAVFACLPLVIAALPARWRATKVRLASAVFGSAVILASAAPVANRLIGARPSGVDYSQILFDLGGITWFSGTDAFPPVAGVADPTLVNRSCYHPALWDSYAWWTDAPCPIGWNNVPAWFSARRKSPVAWWLSAIVHHPIAYVDHRMRHFAVNSGLVAAARPDPVLPPRPDANPYGFDIAPNLLRSKLQAAATAIHWSPFGRPISWIAASAAILAVTRKRVSPLAGMAASSSLLFGLSYAVISVASDLRYHLWTALGALIALVGTLAAKRTVPAAPKNGG